jgi:hypothetical protein
MARYAEFLGRFVDVQYRAGDICLPASGTFVGDSGRSVFLEQHYEQHGQLKNFRWEIPYQCIIRLEEAEALPKPEPSMLAQADEVSASPDHALQANAAHAGGSPALLPMTQRPKTA